MFERTIFLVGFMGAGKTTIGRALALQLAREFIDLDELIVANSGLAVTEIFAQHGEQYFRALERETLISLSAKPGIVAALGGGAFVSAENRAIVRAQGVSIWLDCALAEILKRLGNDKSRPLFRTADQMAELLNTRRPAYQEADLHIDVTARNVDESVAEIISRLDQLC